MAKLLEAALVATIGGCAIVGAFQAGKFSERQRWRIELAAGNARLEKDVAIAGVDVVGVDQQLIEDVRRDREKLAQAEADVAKSVRPPDAPPVGGAPDVCRPVPAHCLRRRGAGGAAGGVAATGGG